MTNSILQKIYATKQQEVALSKQKRPLNLLMEKFNQPVRDFTHHLMQNQLAIIAEIKKASPSQGIIRADFDVATIATIYEQHGASCLSVLTDESYFQGAPEYIARAKESCHLPVLRKDFIIDPYQIYESRALGADCILLIVALLDAQQLHDYCQLAQELGMAVLVESHTHEELLQAIPLPTPLMGVNNRDLNTFTIDIQTSITLKAILPDDKLLIAESGIHTKDDLSRLQQHGIHKFLIGESLMRHADIGQKLDELLGA